MSTVIADHLNDLIRCYAAAHGDFPALTWPRPLEWRPWPERPGWLTATVPPEVGTIGAYELGRCAFKRAGLDYLVTEACGIATAIHVGPAAVTLTSPVTGPDGDNPITDEQILELRRHANESGDWMLVEWTCAALPDRPAEQKSRAYLAAAAARYPSDVERRARARARCAAAYNARHAAEGRPLMHHRRYASGRRTCDLDGQNPTANAPGHEDTHDPTSVDCPMCIADLRARNLLPEAHP